MNFDLVNNRTIKKLMNKGDAVLGREQLGVGLAPTILIFCKSSSFDTSINMLEI